MFNSLPREFLNVFFAAPGGRLFEGEKKKEEEEKRKKQEQKQQQEQKIEKIRRECSPIFLTETIILKVMFVICQVLQPRLKKKMHGVLLPIVKVD